MMASADFSVSVVLSFCACMTTNYLRLELWDGCHEEIKDGTVADRTDCALRDKIDWNFEEQLRFPSWLKREKDVKIFLPGQIFFDVVFGGVSHIIDDPI
jgi:hypothetical protein